MSDSNQVVDKNNAHAVALRSEMAKHRKSRNLCDVTLIANTDGQRIPAHRLVLASSSEYFQKMFTCGLQESTQSEVTLTDVNGNILNLLIDYCYSGKINIDATNVEDMISAASLLCFSDVMKMCADFLIKQVDASNCLGFNALAKVYDCKKLMNITHDYMCEHFTKVALNEEFMLLDDLSIKRILNDSDLNVRSEEFIYQRLIDWVRSDKPQRCKHYRNLLGGVRLALLTERTLKEKVVPVCRILECSKELNDNLKESLVNAALRQPRKGNSGLLAVFSGGYPVHIALEQYFDNGGRWRQIAKIPMPCYDFACAILDNQLLVLGGSAAGDCSGLNTVYSIDLREKTCKSLAPMLTKRDNLCAATIYGKVYAVGGTIGTIIIDIAERYDPATDSWSFLAPMLVETVSASAAVIAGQLYVVGGASASDIHMRTTQMYDPETNLWTEKSRMKYGRRNHSLAANKGYLYVVGGLQSDSAHIVERYDSKADVWQTLYSLLTNPNLAFNAFLSDDRLQTVGMHLGEGPSTITVEEYNLQTSESRYGDEILEDVRKLMHFGLCHVFQMP